MANTPHGFVRKLLAMSSAHHSQPTKRTVIHTALRLAGTLPSLPRGALPSLYSITITDASLQGTLPQLFGSGGIEYIDLRNLGLSGYTTTINLSTSIGSC